MPQNAADAGDEDISSSPAVTAAHEKRIMRLNLFSFVNPPLFKALSKHVVRFFYVFSYCRRRAHICTDKKNLLKKQILPYLYW